MKRRTLRRRIYALLARWFLLLMVAAGLVMTFAFARFRDTALAERLVLARSLARHLDTSIGDLFQNLRSLAADRDVLDGKAVERLRAWRFHHVFRDAVYVLDARANVVLADPPEVEPLAEPSRHESVTPLAYKSRGHVPFVAIVQPFRIDRERYSLVAEMHLPGALVNTMLRELAAGTRLRLLVVDARGAILAADDERGLFQTIPQAAEVGRRILAHRPFVDPQTACWACGDGGGQDHVTLMVPLEMAPWGVVLQEPHERVFAAVYASRATLLGTLALLAGFGVFLSWVLTRTVISPLRELSEQAAGLRGGDLARPIGVAGDQELHVLGHTLDEARRKLRGSLEELRHLNENLEKEVAERTAEIEELLTTTLDQDAQRRVLVRRLLEAGEEERKRIARELHDEISQLLAIVQISLDDVPAAGDALGKAKALLLRTQEELHRLIYDLRPSLLDDLGLAAAVKWYAENYLAPRGLAAHLEIEEDLDLAPEIEITAFRIYQEIVTNILRHAGAENVSVELYAAGDKLVLAVEDDGVGFAAGTSTGGVGIVGMRERAEIVGGTLEIDSEPGMGTQVIVELPLTTCAETR